MLNTDILLLQVDYEYNMSTSTFDPLHRYGQEHFQSNISILLQWSPYSSELELMKQVMLPCSRVLPIYESSTSNSLYWIWSGIFDTYGLVPWGINAPWLVRSSKCIQKMQMWVGFKKYVMSATLRCLGLDQIKVLVWLLTWCCYIDRTLACRCMTDCYFTCS